MATFTVAGTVTVNGRAAAGVTVGFTRKPVTGLERVPPPIETNKLGQWAQDGFQSGARYAATAEAAGIAFDRDRLEFTGATRNLDFHGTADTFVATGIAREAPPLVPPPGGGDHRPLGIAGVQVTFERIAGRAFVATPPPAVTGADGQWRQGGFQAGASYQARASKAGLAFSPVSVNITPGASSEFFGSSSVFTASGRVRSAGQTPEPGVQIAFTRLSGNGSIPGLVNTGGDGRFQQAGFERGTRYRATPRKAGLVFEPVTLDFSLPPDALPAVSLEFLRHTSVVISGQVLSTQGAGLLSTVIRFERVQGEGAVPQPVTSVSNGEYRAQGLDIDTTYRLLAERDGFGFEPATAQTHAPGTLVVNLTGFPAYRVTGIVDEAPPGWFPDFNDPEGSLAQLVPIGGAIVSFHRRTATGSAPPAAVSGADGTWHQAGFEVGFEYTIDASAPGFVDWVSPVSLPGLGPLIVSLDRPGTVADVLLILQKG